MCGRIDGVANEALRCSWTQIERQNTSGGFVLHSAALEEVKGTQEWDDDYIARSHVGRRACIVQLIIPDRRAHQQCLWSRPSSRSTHQHTYRTSGPHAPWDAVGTLAYVCNHVRTRSSCPSSATILQALCPYNTLTCALSTTMYTLLARRTAIHGP
ncbi:hypothetical protein BJV78DRAFT_173977 [Lactifluus subvellereus]|nr:hypothetical protein BJV78DRAFT_173977 [Lactifluus subvellereus]